MLTNTFTIPVVKAGNVAVANGIGAFTLPKDADLVGVSAYAATAPATTPVIVNVAKNGTKLWATTDRVTIAAGSNAAPAKVSAKDANAGVNVIAPTVSQVTALASFTTSDVVRVDVDAIGTGTVGADLTVLLEFKSR